VKFLAAFVLFLVASLLTGRSQAADNVRRNLRFWLNLNIALAVLIVCLSGVLRTADKIPKDSPENPPSEQTSPDEVAPSAAE
jgi:hypothetical protein